MALEILYAPLFLDNLEKILAFFDERNGNNSYSRKLLKMIHKQIRQLRTMPEIGRLTDMPSVRILFVERYGIVYQIRDKSLLIVDIYSCLTNPDERDYKKK